MTIERNISPEREDHAVDALIAAVIRHAELNDVDEAAIQQACRDTAVLPGEARAALERLGPCVLRDMGRGIHTGAAMQGVSTEQYAAMHRNNPTGAQDAGTEAELERLRKKLLGHADEP